MNQEEKEKLFNRYVTLDQLGAIVNRIQRYRTILSMKDDDSLTTEEQIWLLAYAGLENEFKPGTEESTLKAGNLSVTLESAIPVDFK